MEQIQEVPRQYQCPIFVCKTCKHLISLKSHFLEQKGIGMKFVALYFYQFIGRSAFGNIFILGCLKCKNFIGFQFVG